MLACGDESLCRLIGMVDPVEEGVFNDLAIEGSTAQEQGHGFEEVQNRFGFEDLSAEQVAGGFDPLQPFSRAEEVVLETEKKIDRLVEARALDLPDEPAQSEDHTCGRDRYGQPGRDSHDRMITEREFVE